MRHTTCTLLALLTLCATAQAQKNKAREAEVHAVYSYIVTDNDNISLRQAKEKCIALAQAEAMKAEFGELVTSDAVDNMTQTNGEAGSSFFWENTVSQVRGRWLGNTKDPQLDITYADGQLTFTAEVWGRAREIIQAETELRVRLLKNSDGEMRETTQFTSGERFYVDFQSPIDGYVLVYLNELANDEVACLLPYANSGLGSYEVKGGKSYTFFQESLSPTRATFYKMTTSHSVEDCQLVVIFSPKPFSKGNDSAAGKGRPNTLSSRDFQKWLLKNQRSDDQMVIQKRLVHIINPNAED